MKLINFVKTFGVATATPFVPLMVVSCSEDFKYEDKEFDYSEIDWSVVRYFEATVSDDGDGKGWNDGDTFSFDLDTINTDNMKGSTWPSYEGDLIDRTRLMNIDTPEMGSTGDDGNYTDTDGVEREIAEAGADFANAEMPAGTRVRVITNMQTTYNRIVGTVFYGDNFEKNWEVEVMKKGLAKPTLDDASVSSQITETWAAAHYLAYPMFYNFQYSKQEKLGLWQHEPEDVFATRGWGDVSAMDKTGSANTMKEYGYSF